MGMQMTGTNSIFGVASEHVAGLLALILFPLVAWCLIAATRALSGRGYKPAVALQRRFESISFVGRVALLAMLVGAVVHAAIIPAHWADSRVLAILFLADVIGFLAASAWLLLQRRHWRLYAVGMLAGTVAGYVFYLFKGWESPDLVGLVTTGIELAATLVLLMPDTASAGTRIGRRWATFASMPIAAVTMLGAASLAGGTTAAAQAGASVPRASMPSMNSSGRSTSSAGSMPSMSGAPSAQQSPSMAAMNGSTSVPTNGSTMPAVGTTPSTSSVGSMPGMASSTSPSGGTTTMPGMGGGGSSSGTGTMPGMGGGNSGSSGGGALSLTTTSPAGPIVWPLSMGAMGPGMQMVTPNCTTSPTSAQQSAAVTLVDQTVAAASRYQSLANALADGYVPVTPTGLPEVHYAKPSYINDGNILDSNAIESLVYANTPHGAILVAAMYLMASNQVGATPPMPGGCLTEWHVHTNLCFSNTNGTVVGVTSGGTCKAGSTNHVSQPMIHIWLAPIPGGPLVVDASNAQVLQAAGQLPTPGPPNPTA